MHPTILTRKIIRIFVKPLGVIIHTMNDVVLNSGRQMPRLGFGTWNLRDGEEAVGAVTEALHVGYRMIDTAMIYGNEASVGKAIADSGINREEIFVVTKLWNSDQGYETAHQAFELSLHKLGMDYVDLYLIHWPGHDLRDRADSWRAMSELFRDGKARSIGVSNFMVEHLEEFSRAGTTVPAVNQIEFHPLVYKEQKPVLEYCRQNGIAVQAYSPLAGNDVLNNPTVKKVAGSTGRTPAQVLLRWCIQHGTVPLPKSAHAQRIRENFDLFDFELGPSDMKLLDGLGNWRI
jgi:diketogulonate reductase-like aldo/keto reductase